MSLSSIPITLIFISSSIRSGFYLECYFKGIPLAFSYLLKIHDKLSNLVTLQPRGLRYTLTLFILVFLIIYTVPDGAALLVYFPTSHSPTSWILHYLFFYLLVAVSFSFVFLIGGGYIL
jgi:hypothetical protein